MQGLLFDPGPAMDSAPCPGQPTCGGKRFVELPAREQLSYETWCLDQLVPDNALVRVIDAILERLDVSALEAAHPGGGRPAYPPRLMCKLLIYGYSQGVLSSREMSRRIQQDQHYMWLAHGMHIDHELLSDFRTRFGEPFKRIFEATVRLAAALGMVSLGHISIDGSKIAAHARRRAMTQDDLDRAIARVRRQIAETLQQAAQQDAAEDEQFGKRRGDELPKDLSSLQALHDKLEQALQQLHDNGRNEICVNDPDAPLQKSQDGKRPGYNAQVAVDSEEGIIVGQDVVPDQNETEQFMPMAQQAIETLGLKPDELAADTGYHSGKVLSDVSEAELNAYIAEEDASRRKGYTHSDFDYDAQTDTYICPAGKLLVRKGSKELQGKQYRFYRTAHTCRSCPQRDQCISSNARYRELMIGQYDDLILAMRAKVATEAGAAALQKRRQTAEPTFGTIKAQLGLRQFLLVGLEKVRTEFCLAATAFNLRKIAGRLAQEGSITERLDEVMA